jgi:sugar phosphate isomerase/epimerase
LRRAASDGPHYAPMLTTRTGGFPLGFRQRGSDWERDLDGAIAWAKAEGLGVIDLGRSAEDVRRAQTAGMRVGTADLDAWGDLASPDPAERAAAVERNAVQAAEMAALDVAGLFCVLLPKDASRPRRENFGYLVESLRALAPRMSGLRLAIEGWPGPGALGCSPETIRALIQEVGPEIVGINYDPSHLLRMGIDPIRFLHEFADQVVHVHGKDTEIDDEAAYEIGWEQPGTFSDAKPFGSFAWRYTVPGHGRVRWTRVLEILRDRGYRGAVCIELEDASFMGSEEAEKRGVLAGARFLADV